MMFEPSSGPQAMCTWQKVCPRSGAPAELARVQHRSSPGPVRKALLESARSVLGVSVCWKGLTALSGPRINPRSATVTPAAELCTRKARREVASSGIDASSI